MVIILALALLMFWIFLANNIKPSAAFNNLAVGAHFLNGAANFHFSRNLICAYRLPPITSARFFRGDRLDSFP